MNNDLESKLVQPSYENFNSSNYEEFPRSKSRIPDAGEPYTPMTGQWKDDLCDCFSNLWPSCCCVTLGGYSGGCLPMWLAGQIANRIGWIDTIVVFGSYLVLYIIFWIVGIVVIASTEPQNGQGWGSLLFFFPIALAFVFLILLRFRFVSKFKIRENGFETFCTAFWCTPCSLCQMARHLYGYQRVFDGDGLTDGGMVYSTVPKEV